MPKKLYTAEDMERTQTVAFLEAYRWARGVNSETIKMAVQIYEARLRKIDSNDDPRG